VVTTLNSKGFFCHRLGLRVVTGGDTMIKNGGRQGTDLVFSLRLRQSG
jgi:hypothetical protein